MNRLIKVFFRRGKYYIVISAAIAFCGQFLISCKEKTKPTEKVMVAAPEKMDDNVRGLIKSFLEYAVSEKGKIDDTTFLHQLPALINLYKNKLFAPQWSSSQKWLAQGD